MVEDFPKLQSPFVRDFNDKGEYVVTDKIAPGYEWVFEDPDVICVEKLHGTNVAIVVENGFVREIYNRQNRIPILGTARHDIILGVMEALRRGYVDALGDGVHFGELIGTKMNGNEHKVDGYLWYPFELARRKLRYKSWGKHEKSFQNISDWFQNTLFSLYAMNHNKKDINEASVANGCFVEGVVFYQPSTGKMAKLRRDQFPWFKGRRHNT